MTATDRSVDAIVIGGGFYGSAIAIYLAKNRGLRRIVLVEQESQLLTRASYNNQARVHNGYHYPRSFTTAYRSRVNFPRFIHAWPQAIKRDFTKLYAIARRNSKVTAKQFLRFCHEIGARIEQAEPAMLKLFEPRLIEDVFLVEEYAFDATQLAKWVDSELKECGIRVMLNSHASSVSSSNKGLAVAVKTKEDDHESFQCRYVFNCTYSGLNQLGGEYPQIKTGLKHEIAEMALVLAPPVLKDVGVTVMDGSFFSMMPFPARGLHTLSHVRYTPHFSWKDERDINPYQKLAEYDHATRVDRMIRDAGRYLPALLDAKYVDSLFEVKTVLVKNENDDGRPILFEKHEELPGCFSILGGKIDNIFDVFEKLELEEFESRQD